MRLGLPKHSLIGSFLQDRIADLRDLRDWFAYRRQPWVPPPHVFKSRTVIALAKHHGIGVLIETGTYRGEMVRKCLRHFEGIWSIELDEQLAADAAKKFSEYPHVHILQGDSSSKLPEILTRVNQPALFWLDGHFSGGITARADKETPLLEELRAVRDHHIKRHVLLIDDARLFGTGGYPTMAEVTTAVHEIAEDYQITLVADVLRCEPA